MKFKEGKVLEKFVAEKNGEKINVIFRYPKMSYAKDLMKFINSLVEENAYILVVEKVNLTQEKKWLRSSIDDTKNKKKIQVRRYHLVQVYTVQHKHLYEDEKTKPNDIFY
mgnify:CR=1 FL=1